MKKIDEINNPGSCLNKAADDEILFVLRAKDPVAPMIIRAWTTERVRLGLNSPVSEKIREALSCADAMERYRLGMQSGVSENPGIFVNPQEQELPESPFTLQTRPRYQKMTPQEARDRGIHKATTASGGVVSNLSCGDVSQAAMIQKDFLNAVDAAVTAKMSFIRNSILNDIISTLSSMLNAKQSG